MITFEEQLQQTENDNSIIGKKAPKVQTLSDVANTGVYSANDWIELPETKATSGEIIREGLRASQHQLNKIPTELKATMGQAMMSPESVLKIIPFTSMPTMITEQAKVKIFGGTKEASFSDFTGNTRVKQIGKELVQAAYRELKEKDKQYAQRATPLTEEEADTWKYGIASGIGNYGPMLAIGYLTGGVGALSFAVAQEAGQKTEEKLDYYAQKTGDTELKGYTGKQAGKDLALTSVYTAGMGIMEKYIGIGKQMKLFKMSGGEYLKNIALTTLSEGLTEGLEDLYASGIDLVGGYIDTSKLPERYMQAVKSAVIGGLLGGTAGIGTAMAHRSQAKLILRKQYEKTIPAKDIDKVVNAIYDSTADTLQKVVATELVNSESLRNKHGELYNSLKREISNQIKASGAYADVDEAKLANYIESVAKLTADNALGEANRRGVLLQDVLDSTEIKFENGELRLVDKQKVSKMPLTKQEILDKVGGSNTINEYNQIAGTDLSAIKRDINAFYRGSGVRDITQYFQSAFAGSRVDYDEPSLEAIGTGEGAQAHGWGLYYALNRDVAEGYRETFTKGQSKLIIGDKSIEELINSYDWNNEDYDIADNMIDEITRHLEFRAKNQKDTYEERQSVLRDIGNYIQDLRGYLKKGSDDEVYIKHVKEDLENAEKLRDKIATYNAKEFKFEEQKGQVHEVDIPENPYLLDEDATYFAQPEIVRNALDEVINNLTDEQISKEFEGTVYLENRDALRRMWKNGDYDFRNEGGDIYKSLSKMLGSKKEASQMLEKYGIKGITYDGRRDGRCFVIFDDKDVKVIQKFYQINHLPKSKKETIKGSFDALTKSIKITSDADFSTYQHEFAHFWLDNMFNYAHSDLASENYKKDFKVIEKWLKYDDTRQSYLTRQQHEQFARGYEKFLYKGEVANPIIGKAYNDYENFIREVYSSMTEIDTKAGYKKYKAVPAKVYEFFNNMVRGELPNYGAEVDPKAIVKKEVEDTKTVIAERNKVIAENKKNYDLPPVKTDNTSGYMSETAKPKNIKPIENIEDKSILTAYAKTMGEDVEAGRANLAKDYATATEFVNKNPELAGQIVRGEVEAPTGMLKNSIYMAYNELQKKLGNTKNRAESALNQALELRRYGQEIASQRLAYMSEINPEYWIGRILTSKASQLAKENRMSVDKLNTIIKEAIESGMAENKTPKEIAKELRDELGVTELYQTEIAPTEDTKSPSYNYIYKYVNEQLGLGMKEADAMEILRRTDDMWANIENSKAETGNPSIEYFEKLKALEDFANTLAPSSNLRVFVSVISPGSLLLNIKSSLTNIISNLPTGLMRAAVRRIRLGQMTSLVSPEKIALNKHYVWEVFAKTGYNITDMTELTPESKYHGEEITHSQGKGALRALGRWYEKVVYKWSLGAGDIFYKNLAFNDYASLLATKLANGDAKVANDLFDDAIRIEPLTQYGKAIRRMARDEALIATYQNDTALSKSAMKLRDATDFGVGLSKFFIPFVKTPANVIDLGLKTGFGSFKAIVSEVHRDMKAGKILKPTKENIELCIENGLGFALGFALSSMFDDDDYMPAYSMASAKDKQLAKELNIPFNSVRIGNTWFNLDYLGPLAVPLVGILNARREKDIIEKIGAFGKAGLMQIAALPAFGEIDDLMQKIEQYQHKGVKESAEQFVDNLGETIYSRIVPSIVNDVAKVLDGYDRERKGNEIITQIPFARENAPLKYNVTSGRPEEINQWWGIFTGARVKTQVVNSVAREIERLNNTGNGVSLTPVTRSGLLSSLSDNKKQQVNKEFAKEYAKQVSDLIKTYKYKNSNDEDKKDMIDKIRRKIVKELKQEYLQK